MDQDDSPAAPGTEKGSRSPASLQSTTHPPEEVWQGAFYQDRLAISGKRLIDEGTYDAVCYPASSKSRPGPREPAKQLDWRHFSAALKARIKYLKELGIPR